MNTQDARRFNHLARTALAPANAAVARQITGTYGIMQGTAIDIGSGPAHLAIELAKLTTLRIYALDASPAMHDIANGNIRAAGLGDRITPVIGDARSLPCPDATADLIISKGSVFFWDDPGAAFHEIRRVLKPGGKACIGGGFGSAKTFAEIQENMDTIDATWIEGVRERLSTETADRLREALKQAGITDYTVLHDPWQLWVIFGMEETP